MPKKKEIPKSPRFDLISELAYKMLVRIGADKLPIDLNDIFKMYPKVIPVPFTEFKKHHDVIPDSLNFDIINARIDKENEAEPYPEKWKDHIEAITIPCEATNEYFIYYDDRTRNEPRIRWSLAHELGHIFVKHFVILT